jgi:hypothetical protein
MNLLYKLIGEVERFFFAFSKTYHIKFPLPTALTQFSSLYPFLSDTRFFFSFFPFPCFFFSLSCAFSSTANRLFFWVYFLFPHSSIHFSFIFSPSPLLSLSLATPHLPPTVRFLFRLFLSSVTDPSIATHCNQLELYIYLDF